MHSMCRIFGSCACARAVSAISVSNSRQISRIIRVICHLFNWSISNSVKAKETIEAHTVKTDGSSRDNANARRNTLTRTHSRALALAHIHTNQKELRMRTITEKQTNTIHHHHSINVHTVYGARKPNTVCNGNGNVIARKRSVITKCVQKAHICVCGGVSFGPILLFIPWIPLRLQTYPKKN